MTTALLRSGFAAVAVGALVLTWGGSPAFAADPSRPELRLNGSATIGYDDNPAYDSTRDEDLFARQSVDVRVRHRLGARWAARGDYQILNVNYFEATDQSVLGQRVGAGIDWLLDRDTAVEWDAVYRYAYFPDNGPVDFSDGLARAGLARRLGARHVFRAGYSRAFRRYSEREHLDAAGRPSGDRRRDARHEADASLSGPLGSSLSWGAGVVWRLNDSNDRFHDFYDYRQWEPYAALRIRVDDRTALTLRGSYQRRDYDSRPLIDDASASQEDDSWSASADLRYKLGGAFWLVAAYFYRQRESNEPFQEYSGSLTTLGIHAAF